MQEYENQKRQEEKEQRVWKEIERIKKESTEWAKEAMEKVANELKQKEKEDQDWESQDQGQAHDDPIDPVFPSSNMTTKDPSPALEFGLIPFTPSKGQLVADLNTIFYDKNKKRIVMRTEKRVDTGKKKGLMVTEKTVSSMGLTKILNPLQGQV